MTPVTPTPERSVDQCMDALAQANVIRIERARLKREAKAGRGSVRMMLEDPPEAIGSMYVLDLLMAKPRVGRVKAEQILRACEVSTRKRVAGLTGRQRKALIVAVGAAERGYQRPASPVHVGRG